MWGSRKRAGQSSVGLSFTVLVVVVVVPAIPVDYELLMAQTV